MSSERMMVLNMVSDGKLTVEDAVQILSLLTEETEHPMPVEDRVEVVTVESADVPLDEIEPDTDVPVEQIEPPEEQPPPGPGVWSRFKQFVSSIG